MQVTTKKQNTAERLPARRGRTWSYVRQHWILYVMLIPGIIMFFLFMYKPMVGLLMAFENYNFKKGIFGSEWVGLANFKRFFRYKNCWRLIRNTLLLNVFNMLWTTPINIIFALMINEFRENYDCVSAALLIRRRRHFNL